MKFFGARKLSLTVAAVVLGGCAAPHSIEELRAAPAGTVQFEVEQDYKPVFDVVLARSHECYLKRRTAKQLIVSDHRNVTTKNGNVTVALAYDMAGTETYLNTDVEALDANHTRVTVYFSKRRLRKHAEAVEGWVKTGSDLCLKV